MQLPDMLETDRLYMRPHRLTDFDGFYAFWGDKEATRSLGIRPEDQVLDQARKLFEDIIQTHKSGEAVFALAIIEKGNRSYIGSCGFIPLEQASQAELYYFLQPDRRGRGYGEEIGVALLEYGFSVLNLQAIASFIHPENSAGQQIAEKVGMSYQETVKHAAYTEKVKRYACSKLDFFEM